MEKTSEGLGVLRFNEHRKGYVMALMACHNNPLFHLLSLNLYVTCQAWVVMQLWEYVERTW